MQKLSLRPDYAGKLNTIIKYGIAAILIAVPLYPKFPFLNVPGIYVSIRVEDFLIFGVAILWFISIVPRLKEIWSNKSNKAIIIFIATVLVSTLSGIVFLHTTTLTVGMLSWARRLEYVLGFFIAVSSIKSEKDVVFYVKCIGVVLVLVFIFGVGQKYFNFPVITTQNSEYSKGIALRYVPGTQLVSTFAGHYDLASYILLVSPVFAGLYFAAKKKVQKVVILVIIASSFWLMINAASRITAVAYVLSMSTTLFILRKYKYIFVVAAATGIFTLATGNLFDRYLNIFNVIKSKLMGFIPTAYAADAAPAPAAPPIQDLSTSIRLNIEWPRAIRAFFKNPLLGTGYGSTTLATDNDFLRVLGETGLLGFVSLFFVFFRITKELVTKSWRSFLSKKEIDFRTAFLAGMIGVIPGILVNAIFIDVFEASKFAIPFWIMAGLALSLVARNEKTHETGK